MFPAYRKYAHNKTFYKVISKHQMLETTLLGNTYSIQTINSKIMPDRNFINDVYVNANNFLLVIDEEEYNNFMKYCFDNLKKVIY